ncbi:winged helix-turn-helix domain-containing protein [Haladaptatus sp. AB643]|uniref:ArsR/SmtB family transcription factor n=2 Tax=unclassified Haladaptatus TaxID=2622732 RepID=UPI0031841963
MAFVGNVRDTPNAQHRGYVEAGTMSQSGKLWYVLSGSRGGARRAALLEQLAEEPRNANQLATDLDIDYSTVRHHLDILVKHELAEIRTEEYGATYAPSAEVEHNWKEVETIIRTVS